MLEKLTKYALLYKLAFVKYLLLKVFIKINYRYFLLKKFKISKLILCIFANIANSSNLLGPKQTKHEKAI